MNIDAKRVAVITGGGTGIGAATGEELARAGVSVVLVGRRPTPLNETACRINAAGGEAIACPGDIADFVAMEELAKSTVERFGSIDLVVPNASVHDVSTIDAGDPAKWRDLMMINVVGLMNTVRAFLPYMYRQERGHFIIVSSLSGRLTYVGEPAYITSKHAQVAFAECLRKEATPKGIKVTIIEPGLVDTPLSTNPFAEELKKTVPPLLPEEVAGTIRYCFEQPDNCTIYEISLRPKNQLL
jgi:NADP-dependent 3-hydroxy acid dehydrogenase YdfG